MLNTVLLIGVACAQGLTPAKY